TLFLTSGRRVEADFFAGAGECRSLGTDRSRLPRLLRLLPAMLRARREAARFQPHLVVSLGGLTGVAALAAGRRRPLVLLEGNRVIGRGVRLLRPWADAALTLFPEPAEQLPGGRCVGPIGRRALAPLERAEACRRLGLDPSRPVLLLTGGSQGAMDLNRLVARLAPELAARGVQLHAAAGAGKVEELAQAAREAGLTALVAAHHADMGAAYSAADLALCRGGAATVAELWLFRLPAVGVPYPGHADRQQEHNARALEPGVCVERDLGLAAARLLELLDAPVRRQEMRDSLASTAPADGLAMAVSLLEEMAAPLA
ncbi:MAG: UDP-N-acetylglucosamine--N-acetylmuramyl-(pentapeptide) pyrophosphoryl-undecaprenol N-acetylglucosamine transferase, partial [Planctomycetes bacterium]|nr:UDP-N-acetylglucosamine--N-acetylmuramyl-(pentapeptide) pyrophosphoryl-undecaprenol N-acetylglucosamine transferase [Planctomycetota bacterium]